jgi:hypothetical protein
MSFSSYKSRAKKKSLIFNIPKDVFDVLKERPCYFCRTVKEQVGVDRIDNTKGYTSGNCVPCCWDCNRSKSNKTLKEYKDYLLRFNKDLRLSNDPLVIHWFYDSSSQVHIRVAPHSKKLGNNFNNFYSDDI